MSFPFRDNTIARRARSPGVAELEYQRAHNGEVPPPRGVASLRGTSADSSGSDSESMPLNKATRAIVSHQIAKEEGLGDEEEKEEMQRAANQQQDRPLLEPLIEGQHVSSKETPSEHNVTAALREGSNEDEGEVEDAMSRPTDAERKRLRREKLGQRLMEVFGLEEREEVVEEMRCWLLRSVSEWS